MTAHRLRIGEVQHGALATYVLDPAVMAIPIPQQELIEARAMMREFLETLADFGQKIGAEARDGAKELRELAAAMNALAPKKKHTVALTARLPNRFERRRAASRRWRG